MTQEHPITPPTELIKQWLTEFYGPQSMPGMAPGEMVLHVAAVAARWGADQERSACCKWLATNGWKPAGRQLRAARRPKSQGLDKQELRELQELCDMNDVSLADVIGHLSTILHALEQLDD